jgi:hypothetical protein
LNEFDLAMSLRTLLIIDEVGSLRAAHAGTLDPELRRTAEVILGRFPILRSEAARKDSAVHVSLSSIQPVKQLWSDAPTLLEK